MSLISELKRRNVFRVGAAYVVCAWVIAQVADLVLDNIEAPDWVMQAIMLLLAIGFPLVLIFAWAFELTPDGIKRETEVNRAESITQVTGRKLDFAIIGLLAIAVAYLVVDKFVLESEPQPNKAAINPVSVPVAPLATGDSTASKKSIAVLPFDNISPDPADAYFADGIHDEVLAQLSKIRDLKVISRTSVLGYRGEGRPSLPKIAAELGVANILEGSVRLAGNRVRITTQLIEAESDAHLWTETYDRELTAANIFSIQSDVAKTVANALRATLSQEEQDRIATLPTENLAAYQAYLLGKQYMIKANSVAASEAVEHFQQAIELDPSFALAYVELATSYLWQIEFGGLSPDEMIAKAELLLERALELGDRSGEAHTAIGHIQLERGEYEAAEAAYQHALELSPNHADAYDSYGALMQLGFGRPEEALALHRKAVELSPLSTLPIYNIWRGLIALGRYDEAWIWLEKSRAVDPDSALILDTIGVHYSRILGDYAEAVGWVRKAIAADPDDPYGPEHLAGLFMDLGDSERAKFWARKSIEVGPESWIANRSMQRFQLYLGDEVAALEYGRRANEISRSWAVLFPFQLLADQELRAGRYAEARALYEENRPELLDGDAPNVAYRNTRAAIDLASVLSRTGEAERARLLLEPALERIRTLPRLTGMGFPISEVKIYALQGNNKKALSALRQAIDEGWRSLWWYALKLDPGLESLHGDPEYQAMIAEIEADMAAQLERVREMEGNGELEPIPEQVTE